MLYLSMNLYNWKRWILWYISWRFKSSIQSIQSLNLSRLHKTKSHFRSLTALIWAVLSIWFRLSPLRNKLPSAMYRRLTPVFASTFSRRSVKKFFSCSLASSFSFQFCTFCCTAFAIFLGVACGYRHRLAVENRKPVVVIHIF